MSYLANVLLGSQLIASCFCCFTETGLQGAPVFSCGNVALETSVDSQVPQCSVDPQHASDAPIPSNHCQDGACVLADGTTLAFFHTLAASSAPVPLWNDIASPDNAALAPQRAETRPLVDHSRFVVLRE